MVISFTQFEAFPVIDVAVAVARATTNCCFVRLLCYIVLCYTHFLQMFCILFHGCVIRECFISVRNLCVLDAGMLDRLPIPVYSWHCPHGMPSGVCPSVCLSVPLQQRRNSFDTARSLATELP